MLGENVFYECGEILQLQIRERNSKKLNYHIS